MNIDLLVKISARAWAMRILSLLHQGVAGRQAALIAASGAGRTAFGQSLGHLIEIGLVERNPGHGHPLRPEFRLTAQGQVVARVASAIERQADPLHPLLRRAWTLPVLAVSARASQFSLIRQNLSPITDRALTQSLRGLEEAQWMTRVIPQRSQMPRPLYQATNEGAAIAATLAASRV